MANNPLLLSDKNKRLFQRILKTAEKAFKKLYQNKEYKPSDIASVKEYMALVNDTAQLLNTTIKDNEIPEAMAKALSEDVFLFSGLKTHAQLLEASKLLTRADGTIKGEAEFQKDFSTINEKYNQSYLGAEYQYAVSTSQSAANWVAHEGGDRYMLQYRTAGDDKVRASHAAMNETTLPKDDPFWDAYYPPNGWRCRCLVTDVLASRYEKSDSDASISNGEKATTQTGKNGKNKLAIFRYNPGKQKVIFPPEHPYSKVQGAKEARNAIKKAA